MTSMKYGPVLILAIFLASAGCSPSEKAVESGMSEKDKPEQSEKKEVTLQILDHEQLQTLIASHRGKVVVMDIWSTSCGPCLKEFPNFVAFSRKHPESVACISLSLDYEGIGKPDDASTKDPVLGFLQSQQATMDNVLSSVGIDAMCKELEITAPPTAFVYDTEGKLQKVFDDSNGQGFTYEEVEVFVQGLLDAKE